MERLSEEKKLIEKELKINFSTFINARKGSYTEDYKLGGVLGVGAFAEVRKVTQRRTRAVRAMKVINKSKLVEEDQQQKLIMEIQILKALDHPNILKTYEYYLDTKNIYIIIEICTGGELFDKIIERESFTEAEAASIMKQLFEAVCYAHHLNIVHRDIKPENILLDITANGDTQIKLIDWGSSTLCKEGQILTEKHGTAYYIAPEVLRQKYTSKCDMWSCGVVLFILLSGRAPFHGRSEAEVLAKVQKGEYSLKTEEWNYVSSEAKDLVNSLLCFDPGKRLSAQQVLQHPWFDILKVSSGHNKGADRYGASLTKNMIHLKNFRAEQKLQQAAMTFIASQLTSKEEKVILTESFKKLDLNGDGILSREEILMGLKSTMAEEEAEAEVDRIMALVDTDKSGSIDYTEFVTATLDRKKICSNEKLQAAFALFDLDGNGYITAEELKERLGCHLNVSEAYWDSMVAEVDRNNDGVISFSEFVYMMTNLAENSKF